MQARAAHLTATPRRLWQWLFGRTAWEREPAVIPWWEARRPIYNVAVGLSGVLSLVALAIVVPDYSLEAIGYLISAFGYGVLCNVGYTGGWITELLVNHLWPRPSPQFGPRAFAAGLGLSMFVPWLLPVSYAVYLAGCNHELSEADLPGMYGYMRSTERYRLHIANDGRFEESSTHQAEVYWEHSGTWRSWMDDGEPVMELVQADWNSASGPRYGASLSFPRRMGIRSCWGQTGLHPPRKFDDTWFIPKIE